MLDNDPPPGTEIRFLQPMRKAKQFDIGKLRRSITPQYPGRRDLPDDEFEVEFGGESFTVKRSDIERATGRAR